MPRCSSAAALVLLAATCCGPGTSREHAADIASFDRVWETIRDHHFDPTFGGLDWDAVRAELRPRVVAAHGRAEARAILRELVGRLQLSHFAIVEYRAARPGEDPAHPGVVGLEVRPLGDEMVVTAVDDGGPAARAGVRPGWRLEAIGGTPVADLLQPVRAAYAGRSLLVAEVAAVRVELDGPLDGTVEVTFRDGAERAVNEQLARVPPPGVMTRLGAWPPTFALYRSRRIGPAGTIGYLRLTAFLDPGRIMPLYRHDLAAMADARGLVLDLRGNLGGLPTMAAGIAGELVREVAVFGTTHAREGDERFVVNPQAHPYLGPVAILVDELSASTSEVLASGLQELGRARVFGRPTMGAALPSLYRRLPNGDGFQFPVASYVSSGGRTLEGHGVVPDQEEPLDRAALLAGEDAPLADALAWIAAQPPVEEP